MGLTTDNNQVLPMLHGKCLSSINAEPAGVITNLVAGKRPNNFLSYQHQSFEIAKAHNTTISSSGSVFALWWVIGRELEVHC